MYDKKNLKYENPNERKKSEIKKGILKIIFMLLGARIVDIISIVVTGSVSISATIGIGIGATLAFLVSIIKQRNVP